jgi:hypothetical protein
MVPSKRAPRSAGRDAKTELLVYSFALKESKCKIEVPGLHSGGPMSLPPHAYPVFSTSLDKDCAICESARG